MAAGAEQHSPIAQFGIERWVPLDVFGLDVSITNSAFFMLLALVLISGFLLLAMHNRALVPTRFQSMAEVLYEFVAKLVRDSIGPEGMKYFPFVFSIFVFILVLNLLGLVSLPGLPHPFTVTSHIIVTFAMAITVFIMVTLIGFARHGIGYLRLFVPEGVPWWLMPVIVPIELLSYFIRPISHSVRLFANMMAGHTMLSVFAGFVIALGVFGGWAPALFMVAFTGLEVLVACLQAFVFTLLTCIYLNDAINMHH